MYGGPLSPEDIKTYAQWSKADPVDAAELNRSRAVARIQHNGNPLVEYPGLVERLFGKA